MGKNISINDFDQFNDLYEMEEAGVATYDNLFWEGDVDVIHLMNNNPNYKEKVLYCQDSSAYCEENRACATEHFSAFQYDDLHSIEDLLGEGDVCYVTYINHAGRKSTGKYIGVATADGAFLILDRSGRITKKSSFANFMKFLARDI